MTDDDTAPREKDADQAPGDEKTSEAGTEMTGYTIGLALAVGLTAVSFALAGRQGSLIWQPSIPVALLVLAVAQMGVHLVFFLHLTTGPDDVNNIMALAFGVLIVLLVVCGSLWIMSHLNNMLPMDEMMKMQS